jgi:phosphoserine aminotransferase
MHQILTLPTSNQRGYNFSAGPAMLPESVLLQAQQSLLNWQNTGMSILEINHRHPLFLHLMEEAEMLFRQLLSIPEHYHVLFLTQPARTQFAMIPMNFVHPAVQAGYVISGMWSYEAYKEANRLSNAYCVATNQDSDFTCLPHFNPKEIRDETAYIYYTPNETVDGIRIASPPFKDREVPLVADMTSYLLSEPISVENYGLIFAGIQKNIGPAGMTIVIVDDALLKTTSTILPTMLDYRVHAEAHSLAATPAVFQCYMSSLMFQWVLEQGGVDALFQKNQRKAEMLYRYIDSSDFYHCYVQGEGRSFMNVCFYLSDESKNELFLREAQRYGLYGLQGHRRKGGMRVSLYNAMPIEGVYALIDFMKMFALSYAC